MTDPPSSGIEPTDEGEDQRIRDLLAAVPGPGRMPDDLTFRIEAALAQEQRARAASDAPTARLGSPVTAAPAEQPAPRSHADVVDLDARRRRGRGWRALGVAAAAAVIVGGGAVGYAGLRHQSAPVAQAPSPAASLAGRVSLGETGQNYTSAALPTQAASLLASPSTTSVPPQVAQEYGAMATSQGVVACLGSLGSALAADPDHITVDLARYNGTPAVVVVLTKSGKSTAWVVSRSCTSGSKPLAGPATVAT
ncbi:hypothetical protein [Allobranchiibius sp. GilTou73]|uniref:hypothetical protein n=1 Tax=Allobranchiibius sp. GilTou73 TaxID=2904523 RepID=UPI001F3209C6|nr:hypothetical protein [Allobranchiibius sp. GilTou73]UIJ35583.1 hypothetical protein LVQ62_04125 [Allobranchiibius sp. GilTou73]